MVDRDDDLKIGIKSTAVLFGSADRFIIGLLQLATLALLTWVGLRVGLGRFFLAGLGRHGSDVCSSAAVNFSL